MIVFVFFVSLIWWRGVRKQWKQQKAAILWLDIAFLMRLVGALAYFSYAYYLSDGSVDAFVYDNWGTLFADTFRKGDLSPLFDPAYYRGGKFIGTNFVGYPSAIFFLITGYDELSTYFLFSLVAFSGVLWALRSVQLELKYIFHPTSLLWIALVPSIWFWSSTIGKDGFSFLGGGLVMYGVATKKLTKKWWFISLGILITYLLRPPFALILLLSMGASAVLDKGISKWKKIFLSITGILIFVMAIQSLQSHMGIETLEIDEINAQLSDIHRHTDFGGGVIEKKAFNLQGVVQSYIDVFLRPFPWELKSFFYALSLLETFIVLFLLYLIIFRLNARHWFWHDNLFRFLVIVSLFFGLAIGITEVNIGIILRHRSIIHLFIFSAYTLLKSKKSYQEYLRKHQRQSQR